MSMIENLQAMLARGQDTALLRFGLGQAYYKDNNFFHAVQHLLIAVEHDENNSAAWKMLGKTQVELNELDEAKQAFTRGIEVAEANGDVQAVKEMQVFLKRIKKGE